MRTLITGIAGFVGRHFARAIVTDGLGDVHGADRAPLAAHGEDELRAALRSYRTLDVADPAQVEDAVRELKPDRIVHLAAQASGADALERPAETYAVNAVGSLHLLEAVRRHAREATVLLVGSADVYGAGTPGHLLTEEAPLRPLNPYALSKAAQDMIGDVYAGTYGLRVIRCRTFSHTGPGQRPRFALAGFADQLARIGEELAPPEVKVGNLDGVREYGDVRDVARAYLSLLDAGDPGEAYNVCTGVGHTMRDLLDRLIRIAGVRVTVVADPARVRARDTGYLVGDPGKIAARTGWKPALSLERTLLDLYRDARERVRREAGA